MYTIPPARGRSLGRRLLMACQIGLGGLFGAGCFLGGAAGLLSRTPPRCQPVPAAVQLILGLALLSLAWQHGGHLRRDTAPAASAGAAFWLCLLAGCWVAVTVYGTHC